MKILADQEIPYIRELFGTCDQLKVCEGRKISAEHLEDIDVLIVRSITKVNCKLLHDSFIKFIGTVTAGVDHVDQDYLRKRNIHFSFSSGSNAVAVVEYVLAALFWLAQQYNFFLRDKTIGIVGIGNIGNLLYTRLNNFGVHTLLYDPYVQKTDLSKNWKSLDKLISESDIITFHTSLTYAGTCPTWHMINLDVLDALPTDSILINTARGGVIDNHALLKILQCGKKINVILDVWEFEPYLLSPLLKYVNIGTAHIAGYTFESKIRSIMHIYNEYCNNFNILNKIDLSCLLSMHSNYVEIKKLDESVINQLIQCMYNIYDDHISLKNCAIHLGEFDVFRKNYLFRREWSNLYVRSSKDHINEILINLGFSIL